MKRMCLAALAALLFSGSASAAGWQSLGRLNAMTAMPDTVLCKQRVINHYRSTKPTFYPNAVIVYSANNIQFVFDLDVRSLSDLVSNSPSNSRFPTAVNAYNAQTGAKSLYGTVSVGEFRSVGIIASYVDAKGVVLGLGWPVVASELQYYEVQQFCPQ
ncbi:hypothetical protein [Lysobacter hankyongensis]|uniref:Uncharacterized protein n=1 Tax=Lysobacter hankyongensis TaxID=1176535 RepID=A0ABP9BZF3_9GAMM